MYKPSSAQQYTVDEITVEHINQLPGTIPVLIYRNLPEKRPLQKLVSIFKIYTYM